MFEICQPTFRTKICIAASTSDCPDTSPRVTLLYFSYNHQRQWQRMYNASQQTHIFIDYGILPQSTNITLQVDSLFAQTHFSITSPVYNVQEMYELPLDTHWETLWAPFGQLYPALSSCTDTPRQSAEPRAKAQDTRLMHPAWGMRRSKK